MQSVLSLLITATFTAIFIGSIRPVLAQEIIQTSVFNSVVQRSNPRRQLESPPPPDYGAPSSRSGAATHAVQQISLTEKAL